MQAKKDEAQSRAMNKSQFTRALKDLDNVRQFGLRHGIPYRTLMRLRKRGASPSATTIQKIMAGLRKDGVIGNEEKFDFSKGKRIHGAIRAGVVRKR